MYNSIFIINWIEGIRMNLVNALSRYLKFLSLFVVLSAFSIPAQSASQCSGKSSSSCSASGDCSWVEGYKRKDGVKVKSHCRAAPNKAKATESKKKASDSKKSSKDVSSKDVKD